MIDPANDPLRAAVAGVLARDVHGLPEGLLLVSTEELVAARNLLDTAIATHVQALDARSVTMTHCAATMKGWLVQDLHLGAHDATRLAAVGRMLPAHPEIGEALRAGRMNLEHARAISICLRKTSPQLRDVVEKELIKLSEDLDPDSLSRFAREIADRLGGNERAEEAAQRRYASRWDVGAAPRRLVPSPRFASAWTHAAAVAAPTTTTNPRHPPQPKNERYRSQRATRRLRRIDHVRARRPHSHPARYA